MRICLTVSDFIHSDRIVEVNAGPLSVVIVLGMPKFGIQLYKTAFIAAAAVRERTGNAAGFCVKRSIRETKWLYPLELGSLLTKLICKWLERSDRGEGEILSEIVKYKL